LATLIAKIIHNVKKKILKINELLLFKHFFTENSNSSSNGYEPYNPWPDYVYTGKIYYMNILKPNYSMKILKVIKSLETEIINLRNSKLLNGLLNKSPIQNILLV
jgi:hypothetical protein